MKLDAPTTALLDMSDGRRLAFCVRGATDAVPMIWFDGTPGSRLTAVFDHAFCDRFGLQVAAFDRPGYGRSDPNPGRAVAHVASDAAELARHLGWGEWIAVGYSGGGPHALACGAFLPEQVEAVVAVACVAPPDEVADWTTDAHAIARATYEAVHHDHARFEREIRRLRDALAPDPIVGMRTVVDDGETTEDSKWLDHPANREMFDASLREALRPGHEGWRDDEFALHQPWGFALRDIQRPVHFLHGSADRIAPTSHMRAMASHIRQATTDEVAGVGHLAILDHRDRLLSFIDQHSRRPQRTETS